MREVARMRRLLTIAVFLSAISSMGASYATPNFNVHAADPEVAKLIGQWAEHYRKEKALLWLGHEMPKWPQPCPLYVEVNLQGPSGATSFQFGQGQVMGMKMEIQGPLDRLVRSVLPHEVTHTVFAHHFKRPVPRWADEGGSVLSEDDIERERHDQLVRSIVNKGQKIPLRTLFGLTQYPPQVMCLYAQGYSMSDFLVKRSNRQHFLNFVGQGMYAGWDKAVQESYGHKNIEELEQAWLTFLRDGRKQPAGTLVASANNKGSVRVHLTAPPVQPFEATPVARGAMPASEQVGQKFGATPASLPALTPTSIVPNWQPAVTLQAPDTTPAQPMIPPVAVPMPQTAPGGVQLLTPRMGIGSEAPSGFSPIGYPR
jgi:hypothetical protein